MRSLEAESPENADLPLVCPKALNTNPVLFRTRPRNYHEQIVSLQEENPSAYQQVVIISGRKDSAARIEAENNAIEAYRKAQSKKTNAAEEPDVAVLYEGDNPLFPYTTPKRFPKKRQKR